MWANLIGAVSTALFTFFSTRAGSILAGLGLSFVSAKGLESLLGYVIADVMQITAMVGAMGGGGGGGGGGSDLGAVMLQVAAYAGLFDAINIVISGYMAFASLIGMRFFVARISR